MKLTAIIAGPKGFYPGFEVKGMSLRDCLSKVQAAFDKLPAECDGQLLSEWKKIYFEVSR